MENPVLEPRAERIARYKAERRRELAERYGNVEELPSKWVRRDGTEGPEAAGRAHRRSLNLDGFGEGVNGRTREVANGVGADDLVDPGCLRRQGCQDSGEGLHAAPLGLDAPQLHTRVSVGQLRSALLQQSESGAQPDKVCPEAGRATSSLDLAVKPGPDAGRRRTRRYLPGGSAAGRKTSDRFRTQPITANEMEDSSGLVDAEEEENGKADVKTDDRAKMSVAAKMSLFKELEKSAAPEASAFLKPRSGSVCHERRARRGNDHRFLTQPITCEEIVAISAPKVAPPPEAQPAQADSVEDDESCKLTMSEKLALFNKLSLPDKQSVGGGADAEAPPERRRQKGARYRTQPITVEEVSLLQKGPVQLPAFCLSPHLSDRQQASSVNLKPSELRLSQPRLDAGFNAPEPAPPPQGPPRHDPEPGLKGILKKSRPAGSERSRPEDACEQNGGAPSREATGETERSEICPAPRRQRREAPGAEGGSPSAAPWRQRARNRRETIACMPMRAPSAHNGPQEETPTQVKDEKIPTAENCYSSDVMERVCHEEEESVRKLQEEAPTRRPLESDHTGKLQETTGGSKDASRLQSTNTQRWTNLSFEAQEVSSPTKNLVQPQWRHKAKEGDTEDVYTQQETEEGEREHMTRKSVSSSEAGESEVLFRHSSEDQSCTREDSPTEPLMECNAPLGSSPSAVPRGLEEEEEEGEAPAGESNAPDDGLCPEQPPPSACPLPPCGGVAAPESEQDLDVLCQTNAPILTSAVAEHRRSVRPSRRTQGSRNPLRALAAREDIRQDYMGERANAGGEEGGQAENKCQNSDSHPVTSDELTSSPDANGAAARPAFSSLMLLHVKGRRRVQVRLVEPAVRSLNSGDCFLLVTPELCVVWSGRSANDQERSKACELASFIQSHGDLGCEASETLHLREGLNDDSGAAADFWNLLGGRTDYRGAGAPEEDELYESGVVESNCVYRLVENRLVPHEQAWASIPSVSLLSPSEALVFDFGSEVYLWHGRDVPPSRRNVALQLTHQVWAGAYDYSNCRVNPLDPTQCNPSVQLRGEGRPSWALFGVLSENCETALFREKFVDWACGGGVCQEATPPGEPGTQSPQPAPPLSDPLSPCDAKALVSGQSPDGDGSVRTVPAAPDVRRGQGAIALEEGRRAELKTLAVDTWHVQEFDDSEVPLGSTGQLHEGDSYVVRWTYSVAAADNSNSSDESDEEKTTFFLWRGRHSNVSGRDTAAFLSIGVNQHEQSQVVVPQGEEPPCFLQLFQGGLVIHKGKREEASADAGWRLLCVRGELPEEALLLEVDCCCAGLRSRGAVVLLNSQQAALYLWIGCKAHSSVREVGKRAVERLTQLCPPELGLSNSSPPTVHLVEEGSEPADFWTALGQMDRKAYDCMLQDPGKYTFTPRLFHLSASSGSFQAKELQAPSRLPGVVMAMPFVQESLYAAPQPALFLLDNRLEVYLWQRGQPGQDEGSAAAWSLWHGERRCAMQTALQYCKEMNPRRPPLAYLILDGAEPLTFTNVFPRWERSAQGDSGRQKLTLVQDALAQLMKTQYPLEELLQTPLPEGVDPQRLEVYLSDQDFQTILEMKRDEYASLPSWKQIELKKSKGLLC